MTKSVLACHAHTELITCPQGSIITVSHAMYGRVTNYECANGIDVWLSWFQYFATCVVPGTKEKVSLLCDGKQKCEVTADPSFFVTGSGPSCPQTNNYLRVGFTCTSKSKIGFSQRREYTSKLCWDNIFLMLFTQNSLHTKFPSHKIHFTGWSQYVSLYLGHAYHFGRYDQFITTKT